jgi:glycosyltransferase involved in cell wall biosynthesis
MEALASGLPALVSDIPGNKEWITPGCEGWLFGDGDVEGLVHGILQAYEQRQKLAEMGRAARILAEQRADWRKNFQVLLKAYQMAIDGMQRRQ